MEIRLPLNTSVCLFIGWSALKTNLLHLFSSDISMRAPQSEELKYKVTNCATGIIYSRFTCICQFLSTFCTLTFTLQSLCSPLFSAALDSDSCYTLRQLLNNPESADLFKLTMQTQPLCTNYPSEWMLLKCYILKAVQRNCFCAVLAT